ncbi:MAG: hypothetical protein RLZZ399_834 [Verrucomicrobiota bacterium]
MPEHGSCGIDSSRCALGVCVDAGTDGVELDGEAGEFLFDAVVEFAGNSCAFVERGLADALSAVDFGEEFDLGAQGKDPGGCGCADDSEDGEGDGDACFVPPGGARDDGNVCGGGEPELEGDGLGGVAAGVHFEFIEPIGGASVNEESGESDSALFWDAAEAFDAGRWDEASLEDAALVLENEQGAAGWARDVEEGGVGLNESAVEVSVSELLCLHEGGFWGAPGFCLFDRGVLENGAPVSPFGETEDIDKAADLGNAVGVFDSDGGGSVVDVEGAAWDDEGDGALNVNSWAGGLADFEAGEGVDGEDGFVEGGWGRGVEGGDVVGRGEEEVGACGLAALADQGARNAAQAYLCADEGGLVQFSTREKAQCFESGASGAEGDGCPRAAEVDAFLNPADDP